MVNAPASTSPGRNEKGPDQNPVVDRRNDDRRKVSCEGYVYIPMVGWYCRRDATRRRGDSLEHLDQGESETGGGEFR